VSPEPILAMAESNLDRQHSTPMPRPAWMRLTTSRPSDRALSGSWSSGASRSRGPSPARDFEDRRLDRVAALGQLIDRRRRWRGDILDITPGGVGDAAAVRIVTERQGFMELARGHPGDRVQIEGDPDAAATLQQVLSPM
jgi:hypothetical protein